MSNVPTCLTLSENRDPLQRKLEEYKARLDPYKAPELQQDSLCKIAVVKALLEKGQVNVSELSEEMAKTYGTGFNPETFENAVLVIKDYAETGGQRVKGGTGLK